MQSAEFRKLIVDTAEKLLSVEGYELITRSTPLSQIGLDEYKPVYSPEHRCAITVHVCVVSENPLAATLSITRRMEGGEVEFEQPITVRPAEAESRVRNALAVAITKSGEVTLSRVISLVPVQSTLLRLLTVKDIARLQHTTRAVRTALSTKQVDVSYWKKKFESDFPDETVEDASSPSTYRRLYSCLAMRALEEKRNRKRANRPRIIDSPDMLDDPLSLLATPPRPSRPHAPDPDLPTGPLGRDPNMPDFGIPFNPVFQPHPRMDLRDSRSPFGGYGYDVLPNRPRAPRGGFPRQYDSNDYI